MPAKSIRAVERAIDVLDVIRSLGGVAGVSQISRQLHLPKSTVHRLLLSLSNKDMVRDEERYDRYCLGYKAFELAFAASNPQEIVAVVTPFLEKLRDRFLETVTVGVKVGRKFADITCVPSPHQLRWSPMVGTQYPLHYGSLGRAILAFLPEPELQQYLTGEPLLRATPRTITDPAELLAELRRNRTAGYTISTGEVHPGVTGVAAPIRNAQGYPFAGVCVSGPDWRVQHLDAHIIGTTLAEVARQIETACQAAGITGF